MTLFPFLPFCRQSMPDKRKLLDDLRNQIRLTRQSQDDWPRIRIRSLDVIPLSLSLPRHSSLHSITQHIDSHASIDDWLTLHPGSHFATHIVTALGAFYSASSSSPVPRLPPLMTWNPSSLKTIHTQPSPKLSHILKLSRTHICHLQETQWTSLQYNHLHLQAPFCTVFHAPCIDQYSSGVATFLPRPLSSASHSIIEPGFILSVVTSISGVSCELINVYLHPEMLGQKLLDHLLTPHSRRHPIRIIGGDFNHLQSKSPSLFTSLLQELNCSPLPFLLSAGQMDIPVHWTFFLPESLLMLIICISLSLSHIGLPTSPLGMVFTLASLLPSLLSLVLTMIYLHKLSLPRPFINLPLNLSGPLLLSPLPLSNLLFVLYSPCPLLPCYLSKLLFGLGGAPRSSLPFIALLNIITIHYSNYFLPPNPPFCLRLSVPGTGSFPISLTLSLRLSPLFMTLMSFFPSTFFLLSSRDMTFWTPTDLLIGGPHSLPPLLLILGINVVLLPLDIAQHHGAIRSSTGAICTSTKTLDQALRATCSFWSSPPSPYYSDWDTLLGDYAQSTTRLPPCTPPTSSDFYHSTITSPDSAPGADGLPYSAWRVCPSVSAQSLRQHFNDIISSQAPPPLKSLVFIPKADAGDYADNYRPLGLGDTCDRIVDRAAYSKFCAVLMGSLHPAQALLNLFREPQFNYLEIQSLLDNPSHQSSVLLSDLAKAFERVNPHWIMHVLSPWCTLLGFILLSPYSFWPTSPS